MIIPDRMSGNRSAGTLTLVRAGLILLLLASTSCHRPPSGWEQIDLSSWPHTTDDLQQPPRDPRDLEVRTGFSLLGEGKLKRQRQSPDGQIARTDRLVGGSIQTLEAAVDVLIRWQVELGEEPYLTFRPLSHGTEDCPLDYRIGVLTADGVLFEVHREEAALPGPDALKPVIVDLQEYAGQPLELLATVSPDQDCTAEAPASGIWGSPMLYSKKPVRQAADAPPNVLLVGLDTVRADVIGAYGAKPSVTPALDALAEESDVWLQAFSTFNATNPSFSSMMTGLYGKNHGVYDLQTPLPQEHQTLAELLQQAGYDTGAVLSARHLGDRQSGLAQGFQSYILPNGQFAAETAVQSAISWISDRQRPFFLWLHLFDPHTPHTPPEPFASGYRRGAPQGLAPIINQQPFRLPGTIERYSQRTLGGHRALYFGELAYTDAYLGRLFDFLRSRKLLDNTIVVVVADHGENLGEYGISYRHSGLWDTTTHVPLMIRWPGSRRQGRRLSGLVQTLDLFPTLLSRLGLEILIRQDGKMLAGLEEAANEGRRVIFAEHSSGHGAMVRSREYLFQEIHGHRLIPDGIYLYDLEHDPEQRNNLAGRGLAAEERLRQALNGWLAERADKRPQPTTLSAEEVEQLRALGYAAP